jgi:hypothetical protein
MYLVFF